MTNETANEQKAAMNTLGRSSMPTFPTKWLKPRMAAVAVAKASAARHQPLPAASARAPGQGHDAGHGEEDAGRERTGEPFAEKEDGEGGREQGERSPRTST